MPLLRQQFEGNFAPAAPRFGVSRSRSWEFLICRSQDLVKKGHTLQTARSLPKFRLTPSIWPLKKQYTDMGVFYQMSAQCRSWDNNLREFSLLPLLDLPISAPFLGKFLFAAPKIFSKKAKLCKLVARYLSAVRPHHFDHLKSIIPIWMKLRDFPLYFHDVPCKRLYYLVFFFKYLLNSAPGTIIWGKSHSCRS